MIVVEYFYDNNTEIAEFALPLETKIEAELYVMSKCYNDGVWDICHLDGYIDRNGNEVKLHQHHTFSLNDFKFHTVDEYMSYILLTEKK